MSNNFKNQIKILVADHHAIVRKGIISLIEKQDHIKIIAEASNGLQVLKLLESGLKPDLILTDITMSEMDGIDLTKSIKENHTDIKVLILTSIDGEDFIINAMNAGAKGYLLKNVTTAEVIFAIEQLASGQMYLCTAIGIKLLNHIQGKFSIDSNNLRSSLQLSKREIDILNFIAEGYTNSEIADKLFTSKRTIEGNRQSLLDKTGKRNTAALIHFVVKNGIIE